MQPALPQTAYRGGITLTMIMGYTKSQIFF